MKRYYACLLGDWVDITECTVFDGQPVKTFFRDNLIFKEDSTVAECFKFNYINIQYNNKNYRIHPNFIQIVTQE